MSDQLTHDRSENGYKLQYISPQGDTCLIYLYESGGMEISTEGEDAQKTKVELPDIATSVLRDLILQFIPMPKPNEPSEALIREARGDAAVTERMSYERYSIALDALAADIELRLPGHSEWGAIRHALGRALDAGGYELVARQVRP